MYEKKMKAEVTTKIQTYYVLSPPANGRGHTVLPCFGILFYHHSIIINFLIIISAVVAHIQLNFVYECFIKICMSMFKFGPGSMMFDRVMPRELIKKEEEIFSFLALNLKECINY